MINNEFIAKNGHNMHDKKDHDSAIYFNLQWQTCLRGAL